MNINNIEFVQADAITLKFDRQYDNFMMLGLLTYINNEEEAEHIIRNVYEALKQGARLIVRDSLTKTDYREIFYIILSVDIRQYTEMWSATESYL